MPQYLFKRPRGVQRAMKRVNIILLAGLFAVSTPLWFAPAGASDVGASRTYYSTIHYSDDGVLHEFGRKIGTNAGAAAADGTEANKLAALNVDKLVFRVRSFLEMHPPGFHVNIRLHATSAELKEAYRALGHSGPVPAAFYSHGTKTVHLAVETVSVGILAHEVSHAVINSFYDPPIPARMQEIISQYVDEHIRDTE
jgi:ribosomal protein L25 (general stress protein Ctc)